MQSQLQDKIAVVIGGTSGIGLAICLACAEAGAHVVSSSRSKSQVDSTASKIETLNRRTLRVTCDVSDRASLEHLSEIVDHELGHPDILINCAGRIQKAPTLDFPEAAWEQILDVNLTGTLRACQIFGRGMLNRRKGTILNIASLNSFVALTEVAAYAASKAAVVSLTRSLAVEWATRNVRVNAIAPGVVRTELNSELLDGTARGLELLSRTPMQRFGSVDEISGAAVFLASEAASFITGQTIVVDGGFLASGVNQ
jgi:NAD(P)-dependent dehydrogenase (short-subunit alcohol dehydrogenase family)